MAKPTCLWKLQGIQKIIPKVIIFMLMMKMGRMYILQATAHMMECGLSGFSWIP